MRATEHTSAFNHFTHTSFCFLFIQSSLQLTLTAFVLFIFISEILNSYPNVFIFAPYVFPQSNDDFVVLIRMVFIRKLHQGLTWILRLMPMFTLVASLKEKLVYEMN